jgi:nitroimidazol reductase NimA-like FMN-containing flavoprotein (pyridoxamine 5'-phosphate oxidase superfamily)
MTNKMKFNNDSVRRQDRLLDSVDAVELLRTGEYGILSMVEFIGKETGGYGIPINYAWDGENAIYFHCAPEGHKLNCLKANSKVSFCVIGRTNVISNKFTTAYESIIVRGTVSIELTDEERMKALILILDKYSPDDKEIGIKYAEKSFHRTNVMRLDITEVSGKTKRIKP